MYLATKLGTFNNMDCNSFDKDILDADSKKIIQHHVKLKKTCVENTCVDNVRKKRHSTL